MSTYKAWYFPGSKKTSFNDLQLTDRPVYDPSKLKDDEVLVKMHAVSLQFRDLIVANGTYPAKLLDDLIPGSDGAGEVVAVGSAVTEWKKGDRICPNFATEHLDGPPEPHKLATSQGGQAQGVLQQWKVYASRSLVRIPEHLTYEQASTLPCATLTAYNALMGLVPLKGGDTVLVLGSGGVSIAALQLAKASGATVIATTSSNEKAELVKKYGATHVINYRENKDWDQEVLKLTGGRGVDHILEVGGADTLLQCMNAAKWNGLIHIIGFVAGGDDSVAKLIGSTIHKAQIIRGVLIGSVEQFKSMNRLIETAKIVPVVDKVFPFEEAKEAYAYLKSQKHVGKVVIKVA